MRVAHGPGVPAGVGCSGTVKRGCGAAADIQQADAVPRREAEEAAIAAGVAAAAAVPVGRGGQHPHPRRRHRSRAAPLPLASPQAPPPSAAPRRRKTSQTTRLAARVRGASAVKRGGEDGGAVGAGRG